VYAVRFADAGLSGGQIASLFAIWSLTAFVLEIPSGAWADAFSRRRLMATSALLRAAGFALWTVRPTYTSFALGFVLWGVDSAAHSGTTEAMVYDELVAAGATDRYVRLIGRAAATATAAMLVATALAGPALAVGGYTLVGAASVAAGVVNAGAALAMPDRRHEVHHETGYIGRLRAGLGEIRRDRVVRRAVLLAAVVPGVLAMDEFLPLLARSTGVAASTVPLLLFVPSVALAAGGWLAGRFTGVSARRLAWLLGFSALLLAGGALAHHPAGMFAVAGWYGVGQLTMTIVEARLQGVIASGARATVLSVAGFGAEVGAVLVFAGYALGAAWLSPATLVALFAVPMALIAVAVRRWLPPPDDG
jgi:predicted MFS family arabinose efflux permease